MGKEKNFKRFFRRCDFDKRVQYVLTMMIMENTIIYAYTKGNQAYVGKTKSPKIRKSAHKTRFGNWEYKELDEIPSFKKEDWKPYECAWIQIYKEWGYTLANKNRGGSGPEGFRTEEEHKQLNRQTVKQWYSNNKEKYNEYQKQWRLDNKEKRAKATKKYRLANKEKIKQYYLDNKEKWNKKN